MRIVFTEENGMVHSRSRYMRGGLLADYHDVRVINNISEIPDAEMWFHGFSSDRPSLPEPVSDAMEQYHGKIIFFQNGDGLEFNTDKLPDSLLSRTSLFLRNVWPSDKQKVHPLIRDRMGLLNPLLKPGNSRAGKDLKYRSISVAFCGVATGADEYSRINALQMLRTARISFAGGIIKRSGYPVPPDDLLTTSVKRNIYLKSLENSYISLVLHGNNPLTYRLFESFSRRSLVIAQDLSEIWFADCGLKAGVHYISVKKDFSDLIELIQYYLKNQTDAQRIADNGFEHYRKYFQFTGVHLPQMLYSSIINTWNDLKPETGKKSITKLLTYILLPYIHSI